jgi:hypothetical protein
MENKEIQSTQSNQPAPGQPNFLGAPPPEPKKDWINKHLLLGILFVVLALAAIVSAIYYWQTAGSRIDVQLPVHKDQTANWKTYTNDQYGFEFKYKANIYAEDSPTTSGLMTSGPNAPLISLYNINDLAISKKCLCGEIARLQVRVRDNTNKFSLTEYAKKNYPGNTFNLSTTKVGGSDAIEFGEMDHYVLVQKDNLFIVINGHDNNILSTFKFTK